VCEEGQGFFFSTSELSKADADGVGDKAGEEERDKQMMEAMRVQYTCQLLTHVLYSTILTHSLAKVRRTVQYSTHLLTD
jgi:hypothetical protein